MIAILHKIHRIRYQTEFFTLRHTRQLWALGASIQFLLNAFWALLYTLPFLMILLMCIPALETIFALFPLNSGTIAIQLIGTLLLGFLFIASCLALLALAIAGLGQAGHYFDDWVKVYLDTLTSKSHHIDAKDAFLKERLGMHYL